MIVLKLPEKYFERHAKAEVNHHYHGDMVQQVYRVENSLSIDIAESSSRSNRKQPRKSARELLGPLEKR